MFTYVPLLLRSDGTDAVRYLTGCRVDPRRSQVMTRCPVSSRTRTCLSQALPLTG
jgi:hypothetical protein